MRILFFLRHGGYVRNFESVLVELAERGHEVHVVLGVSETKWLEGRRPPLVDLAERYPTLTYSSEPVAKLEIRRLANGVRGVSDWLRYLRPEYANAPKLRARIEARVPAAVRRTLLAMGAATPEGNERWRRITSVAERALPWPAGLDEMIAAHRPDVVCVSPLVDLASPQVDILRSARRLGVPTVLCVASWDNLTNKGLIRGEPDLVTVWNEQQREEAIVLHRQRPENVVATGAQSYDHWFDWRGTRTREEFCARVGLPPERRFVLFLGSSPFIAPDEVPFVRRWIEALRSAGDERVRDLGVLIRPHPQNAGQWKRADLDGLDDVAVWPRTGADPIDAESRSDFHDSIEFCDAVVGINTSALIESAIVGRPVLTILDPDFTDTQEGTLHFEHLRRAGGGLLREAASLDEHVGQLAETLRGDDGFQARNRGFLEAFVRPQGLERRATPLLADAIEQAARRGQTPVPPPPPAHAPLRAVYAVLPLHRRLRRPLRRLRKTLVGNLKYRLGLMTPEEEQQ